MCSAVFYLVLLFVVKEVSGQWKAKSFIIQVCIVLIFHPFVKEVSAERNTHGLSARKTLEEDELYRFAKRNASSQ